MQETGNELVIFIVLSVILFMLLGIALLVVVDHKARLPSTYTNDRFSISGLRYEHPVISFLTALILISIILVLVFELTVTVGERLGLFGQQEAPELLQKLQEHRFTERMRHFHNEPAVDRVNLGKKQACFFCHGDYPHSKKVMIRTLLNMHTQFIDCMTCHTDPKKEPEDSYRFAWLNFSGIKVAGPPYGTSIDPDSGLLITTDDFYSKIVVYANGKTKPRLLALPEDSPDVQEFTRLKTEGALSDRDMEALKRRFHASIMGAGRTCSRCHTQQDKSYLPFQELGFSTQRIADLTDLAVIGIIEKYREFYIPSLFMKGHLPDANLLQDGDNAVTVPPVEHRNENATKKPDPE